MTSTITKMIKKYNNINISQLVNIGFKYVIETSVKYKIDESHALKHSMEVFGFSKRIFYSQLLLYNQNEQTQTPHQYPDLINQYKIIYMAAIGHDMCDKKYMDETEGIIQYKKYLSQSQLITSLELDIIGKIIATMSYSKVKVNGYPDLGKYMMAYHIVREADLLAAYDIDRCVMYSMYRDNSEYSDALQVAKSLFETRVFKMRKDRLFITPYSKKESLKLQKKAKIDIESL
jgi:hypothetical protein